MLKKVASIVLLLSGACSAQVQIIPQGQLQQMRALLPRLEDEAFQKILSDPTTIWYDTRSMPPAYQFMPGNGYLPTYFFLANHNFSGDPTDQPLGNGRGGNANIEFPWNQKPGGAHRAPYVDSFKGLWLPKKNGRPVPVVWFRRDLPGRRGGGQIVSDGVVSRQGPRTRGDMENAYGWVFPEGAVLVEALTTKTPKGYAVVFEIRFRIREIDDWGVEIFRPFPTAKSLAEALKKEPNADSHKLMREAIRYLDRDIPLQQAQLADTKHTAKLAFNVKSGYDPLPSLPTDTVSKLLYTTAFASALGQNWRTGTNGVIAFSPSNEANEYNIVTTKYDGTFVGSDRESCIKCHESTNRHSTVFQVPRGWYGRVRGSDGILSWHPVDPRAVSASGAPVQVRFRGSFIQGGIIEQYNPSRHLPDVYKSIPGLF